VIVLTKAIVVYNSRGGNTKKVAEHIAEGLGAEMSDSKKVPNLVDYDLVVVGTWCMFGRISFGGARLIRKLRRKKITGKKVALFFTAGDPEEIHPFTEKSDKPKSIKEIMFNSMEKRLSKSKNVTILDERFYSVGAMRVGPTKEPADKIGHPSDEELAAAKAFGEKLKSMI
jgi:flavodoxin